LHRVIGQPKKLGVHGNVLLSHGGAADEEARVALETACDARSTKEQAQQEPYIYLTKSGIRVDKVPETERFIALYPKKKSSNTNGEVHGLLIGLYTGLFESDK
jgi:hypothetical protein